MTAPPISLDGRTLTIEGIVDVARQYAPVTLSADAAARVERARMLLRDLVERGQVIYGVTTGLADHKGMRVSPEEVEGFQRRIVLSHVVGVGPALSSDVVRAIMAARANMLAAGGSARVPASGSLGVTDLSHLAHIAQVLLGGGEAECGGRLLPGAEALATAGLQPARLGPKEGLALISANAGSVGRGALVVWDLKHVLRAMDLAAALSLEAFRGNTAPYDVEIERAHPDPGQAATAAARQVIEMELNAAADTPLVAVETGRVISNGNFLVLGVALAFEHLAIALAHATAFSAARTRALMSSRMTGLPGTLIASHAPQTGLSILQETATNLQTAIRLRANPSSLDFQPIADGVEDHATNAMDAVAKVEAGVRDASLVLAVELMTAAQAVDLRGAVRLGTGTGAAFRAVRRDVPFLQEDAPLAPFVDAVAARVRSGVLVHAVEQAMGELHSQSPAPTGHGHVQSDRI